MFQWKNEKEKRCAPIFSHSVAILIEHEFFWNTVTLIYNIIVVLNSLFLVGDDLKVEKMVRNVRLNTAKILVFYAILAISSAISSFNRIRLSAGWLILIMMVRTSCTYKNIDYILLNYFISAGCGC